MVFPGFFGISGCLSRERFIRPAKQCEMVLHLGKDETRRSLDTGYVGVLVYERYLVLAKLNVSNAKQHAKYGSMS